MQLQFRMRKAAGVGLALLATCLSAITSAQPGPAQQPIYSCVDGKGRRLTADRPIAECMDRTQQELSRSGLVKREIKPTLTAKERAVQEQKDKLAAEIKAREAEEKRRDRALLLRYPNKGVHDKERAEAVAQIEEVIKAASKRTTELVEQRKAINIDLEFYQFEPSKAPAPLKRRVEENESSVAVQKRFISEQESEKKRVNQRFDEELTKLRPFWSEAAVAVPASAAKK